MKALSVIMATLFVLMANAYAQNQAKDDEAKGASGLPLPRFASLRADPVNLRTGPGTRYPIEWVYTREGIPVEITKEFDTWRRIRDWEGSEGWVHKSALTGKRTVITTGETRALYEDSDKTSPIVAKILPGVVGKATACDIDWCKIAFDRVKGYMSKSDFWGVYQNETFR